MDFVIVQSCVENKQGKTVYKPKGLLFVRPLKKEKKETFFSLKMLKRAGREKTFLWQLEIRIWCTNKTIKFLNNFCDYVCISSPSSVEPDPTSLILYSYIYFTHALRIALFYSV